MIMVQKDETGTLNCIMTGRVSTNPQICEDSEKRRAFFWVEYANARSQKGKGSVPVKCLCVTWQGRLIDLVKTLKKGETVKMHGIMLLNQKRSRESGVAERYLSFQTLECMDRINEMQIQHIRETTYNKQISGLVDAYLGEVYGDKHDTSF